VGARTDSRTSILYGATRSAGGEPIADQGKSLFILRRQADGSWKIARLIANSDQPRPGSQ
jgi:ketosteroid isomerase-like protein